MGGYPQGVDGFHQRFFLFVWYHHSCVPSCTPVDHVENDELVDEY